MSTDAARATADSSDESEYLSLGHIGIIVGVVCVLIGLQVIGCFVCCRDRWQRKRKLSSNQIQTNSYPLPSLNVTNSNPIEISQVLTTERQPKRPRPKSDVEANEEAATPLMTRESANNPNQSVGQSVVQVHT